jgi:hypothetical protein
LVNSEKLNESYKEALQKMRGFFYGHADEKLKNQKEKLKNAKTTDT